MYRHIKKIDYIDFAHSLAAHYRGQSRRDESVFLFSCRHVQVGVGWWSGRDHAVIGDLHCHL